MRWTRHWQGRRDDQGVAAEGEAIGKYSVAHRRCRFQFDGAHINIPDRQTPERVCTMVVAKERVAECFEEILEKVHDVSPLLSVQSTHF